MNNPESLRESAAFQHSGVVLSQRAVRTLGFIVVTETTLPPERAVVQVITPSGDVRDLQFHDRMWFLPDDSMYVYFRPTHWRRRR